MSQLDSHDTIRDAVIVITASATRRRIAPGPETGRKEFSSLGVDSVNAFEIILQLESKYSVTLTDTFLFENRTPTAAAEALHAMLGKRDSSSGA